MVVLEAFASAVPVVASAIGGIAEIVRHEKSGLLFEAGNAAGLAETVSRVVTSAELARSLGDNARQQFEQEYSAAKNYNQLLEIYERAIATMSM